MTDHPTPPHPQQRPDQHADPDPFPGQQPGHQAGQAQPPGAVGVVAGGSRGRAHRPRVQRSAGRSAGRSGARVRMANSPGLRASLVGRLTARDRWVLAMLHEHRVLTTHQLAVAWPSAHSARRRMLELFELSVVERARPVAETGSAPWHFTLAPAGAWVLAAEHGLDVTEIGYRAERARQGPHRMTLAHTLAVGDFFTALITHTQQHSQHDDQRHGAAGSPGSGVLTAWWGETRVTRLTTGLVAPDAYGRWRAPTPTAPHTAPGGAPGGPPGVVELSFFLEVDLGTSAHARLAARLPGYSDLAGYGGVTPVLVWTPSARREAGIRRALAQARAQLPDPRAVPIATAAADLLAPPSPASPPSSPAELAPGSHGSAPVLRRSPADAVWAPLDTPPAAQAAGAPPRWRLDQLPALWRLHPNPPLPFFLGENSAGVHKQPALPPPAPMPPAPTSTRRPATC